MDGAPVQEFSLQRKWDTTGWSGNFLYYWRNIKSLFWAIRKLINDGKLRTDHWERYLEHEGQIYIGAIEPPVNARDEVESLGQEDPLEEEMATHSSVLAWERPWTEEPGRHGPWDHKELDMTEMTEHPLGSRAWTIWTPLPLAEDDKMLLPEQGLQLWLI